MIRENAYQSKLIKKLRQLHPDWIIVKNDANYLQGIPDWTVFANGKYAFFDVKRSSDAVHQPNQDWYINNANETGAFGMFVYPENEEEFLNEIQQSLRPRRKARRIRG